MPAAGGRVKITKVRSNHARAEELERLEVEDDEGDDEDDENGYQGDDEDEGERLGSRDNFWGG